MKQFGVNFPGVWVMVYLTHHDISLFIGLGQAAWDLHPRGIEWDVHQLAWDWEPGVRAWSSTRDSTEKLPPSWLRSSPQTRHSMTGRPPSHSYCEEFHQDAMALLPQLPPLDTCSSCDAHHPLPYTVYSQTLLPRAPSSIPYQLSSIPYLLSCTGRRRGPQCAVHGCCLEWAGVRKKMFRQSARCTGVRAEPGRSRYACILAANPASPHTHEGALPNPATVPCSGPPCCPPFAPSPLPPLLPCASRARAGMLRYVHF